MPIKNLHRSHFLWSNGRGHNQKPIHYSKKNDTLGLGHNKHAHLTTHASIFEDAFNSTLKNLTVSTTTDEKGEIVMAVANKETEGEKEERLMREKVRRMISRWGGVGGWITFVRGGVLTGTREIGVVEKDAIDVNRSDKSEIHGKKRKHEDIEGAEATASLSTATAPLDIIGEGEGKKNKKRRNDKSCEKEEKRKRKMEKNKRKEKTEKDGEKSLSPCAQLPSASTPPDTSAISFEMEATPHPGLGMDPELVLLAKKVEKEKKIQEKRRKQNKDVEVSKRSKKVREKSLKDNKNKRSREEKEKKGSKRKEKVEDVEPPKKRRKTTTKS